MRLLQWLGSNPYRFFASLMFLIAVGIPLFCVSVFGATPVPKPGRPSIEWKWDNPDPKRMTVDNGCLLMKPQDEKSFTGVYLTAHKDGQRKYAAMYWAKHLGPVIALSGNEKAQTNFAHQFAIFLDADTGQAHFQLCNGDGSGIRFVNLHTLADMVEDYKKRKNIEE